MGFFDFLKSKKKRKAEAEAAAQAAVQTLEVDPSEIDPPETRFTEEYREFLETQEAAQRSAAPTAEDFPAEEPCTAEEEEAFSAEEDCPAEEEEDYSAEE